jgi:regulator of cell morphogenesis and NO signaling
LRFGLDTKQEANVVITQEKTVGEVVAQVPGAARVFEKYQIDYCCGGKHPVGSACRERGIALQTLAQELEHVATPKNERDVIDWNTASLRDLIGHILLRHHAYLRSEFPRIGDLFAKVVSAHSERQPVLFLVRDIFKVLRDELESHMMKEELILFPAIGKLEAASVAGVRAPMCSIEQPIARMEHEHEMAGRAIAEMRHLTGDYAIPQEACNAYRALFAALMKLETDLHRHIHLENNILFPRAAQLQSTIGG